MTPTRQLEGSLDVLPLDAPLSTLAAKFVRLWSYPVLQPTWSRILLLLLVTGLCALRAYIGLMGTQAYSHDAFMLLDGAWRMMNGQRPHLDFYSHLGVMTYAPTVAALWIAGGNASAYGYAQALVGLTLGVWSYVLGRRYLNDVPACLFCLAVLLMAISTSALGDAPTRVVASTTYNRQGYAILAIILVETLSGSAAKLKRNDFLGGLSTGSAVAILLFLKITYFVFGVFLVTALIIPVRPHGKRRWVGMATGFAVVCICLSGYLRFNLIPMCKDLATIFGAKHFHMLLFAFDNILQSVATFLIFVFMATILLLLHRQPRAARALAAGGLAVSVTSLLILGNQEQSGFEMAAFLTIIGIDIITRCIPTHPARAGALHVSVLLLASSFWLVSLASGAIALSEAFMARRLAISEHGLEAPRLSTFTPISGDATYKAFVNDGLDLLSKHRHPGESVMSLDFTNPFSYSLGIKPAPGGTTVLQYRTTFDDTHRQSPESLFGSADLVMLPKAGHFSDGTLDYSIVRIYGSYLEKHFKLVSSSYEWQLYRRISG